MSVRYRTALVRAVLVLNMEKIGAYRTPHRTVRSTVQNGRAKCTECPPLFHTVYPYRGSESPGRPVEETDFQAGPFRGNMYLREGDLSLCVLY